nr:hypothetical protein [Chroococcidiopsis cubana]
MRIQQTGGKVEVSSLPKIDADPVQMQQLLQNLLSNALKFHKQDTPPVVKLFSQLFDSQHQPVTDGAIAIMPNMVEDNGIGFEQKVSRSDLQCLSTPAQSQSVRGYRNRTSDLP